MVLAIYHSMQTNLPTHYSYCLPSGQIISVAQDLCRGASVITYTLVGGKVVDAIIMPQGPACYCKSCASAARQRHYES